jgi:hypothetical protein
MKNNKFDELTKNLAQAVTRRAALKRFGLGLTGMALACLGLANNARAGQPTSATCASDADCKHGQVCCNGRCYDGHDWCDRTVDYCCCFRPHAKYRSTSLTPCDSDYWYCVNVCSAG